MRHEFEGLQTYKSFRRAFKNENLKNKLKCIKSLRKRPNFFKTPYVKDAEEKTIIILECFGIIVSI